LGPSLLGIVPYAGIDLAVYETLRNFLLPRTSQPSISLFLFCGIVSSSVGKFPSSIVGHYFSPSLLA
jgi:solute carrier family 25 phosphate transporter 23/24/25/41